jgi:hypothetical protein
MKRTLPTLLTCLLCACSSQPVVLPEPEITDFSGHWEMDYGRSDNVDQKLQSMYREWRRDQERRARGDQYRASTGGLVDSRSFRALVDVARLAEMITDSQVLEIEQTDADIEIRRENSFALSCVFQAGEPEIVIDEFGAEVCGWDAHQLVFHIRLPDGLDIQHRVTMSSDTERLHIATSVDSRNSTPFTLNRFYFRFDPLPADYSCEYTLSRGNVCQSELD